MAKLLKKASFLFNKEKINSNNKIEFSFSLFLFLFNKRFIWYESCFLNYSGFYIKLLCTGFWLELFHSLSIFLLFAFYFNFYIIIVLIKEKFYFAKEEEEEEEKKEEEVKNSNKNVRT